MGSENYRQVLMVAGNHEYYNNGDIASQGESWQKMFLQMSVTITTKL